MKKSNVILALIFIGFFAAATFAGVALERTTALLCMPVIAALPVLGVNALAGRKISFLWRIYGLWSWLWCVSLMVEVYLSYRYKLVPQSRQVVESLINSPAQEAREYALSLAAPIFAVALAAAVFAFVMVKSGRQVEDNIRPWKSRKNRSAIALACIVLPLAAHGNVIVKRADPITFWPSIINEGRAMQREQANIAQQRLAADSSLASWAPRYSGPDRKTVVIIIGESSNRWDWSLYGYQRQTTPLLDAMRANLLVFKDVISSYGSTITELTRALTPATQTDDKKWQSDPSVIGLAKAAGYKVFWLSNQSTLYVNTLFGEEADDFELVYSGRVNRHDDSYDEKLLPPLQKALQDPAPLKLVVLHTLGSHEDYSARYPDKFTVFDGKTDAVAGSLSDKWFWTRAARDNYDDSILYTDYIISSTIDLLEKAPPQDMSLLYFSDHAQDVGHLTSSYGHQFFLESGFTVPMVFWSNRPGFPSATEKATETRPYQTDVLDWTILPMLGISTAKDQPNLDLMGPRFHPWQREIAKKPYIPGKSHQTEE